MAALNEAQMELVSDLELEMMTDLYNRMTVACQKKCVPATYREGELNKGESVCLDRCVSKYMVIHERIGKKLAEQSQNEEALAKKMRNSVQEQKPS